MSRYRGPRLKIICRLGKSPRLTHKAPKLKPNYSNQSTPSKKVSQYCIRLEEKQKLRFHYGLTEQQLLKYVHIARNVKGLTCQVLLQLLEMRLDNIIFRLGMALTIPGARHLVNHIHILVINNCAINVRSYRCKPKDIIIARDRPESRAIIEKNNKFSQTYKILNHLTLQSPQNKGLVNEIIDCESIDLNINELLVVEYYSCKA